MCEIDTHLQLSIFKAHSCLSSGNILKSIGQLALTVTLFHEGIIKAIRKVSTHNTVPLFTDQ